MTSSHSEGGLRDDAQLFGSKLGGQAEQAAPGRLTEWLRPRQGKDCIVFLDEFEKIKGLTNHLGWDQAKKMYQAFLEPWQEGTLTDVNGQCVNSHTHVHTHIRTPKPAHPHPHHHRTDRLAAPC